MMNGGKNQLCSIQSMNSPIKKNDLFVSVCKKRSKNQVFQHFWHIHYTWFSRKSIKLSAFRLDFDLHISSRYYRHRDSPNKQFARKQPISLSIKQTLFKFIRVSKRRNYKQSINQSDFITCAHRQSLFVYGLNKRCMEYNIYCWLNVDWRAVDLNKETVRYSVPI